MPVAPLHVLIAEDSEDDTELLLRELQRGGYEPVCERVDTADALRAALGSQEWDIVISDYSMPQFCGLEALRLVQQHDRDIPFIIVSGAIGEDTAVMAMKAGAHDYVIKGNTARLVPAIARELKEAQMRRDSRQAQEQVHYLAYFDPLTDLPNRTLLTDRLQQAVLIGRREKQCFALMFLDLDRFKSINDTLGHHAGDKGLQEAAARIKACLRDSDTVARIGGDEFAVLLPTAAHLDGATMVARKILEAFLKPLQIQHRDFEIGVSQGVALFPKHGDDADLLLRAADTAMYEAKRTHCGFLVYSPDLGRQSETT